MMNDIYLEYILKKKKTGGQKAIIAVIIFAAIIVSVALLLLIFATATALSGTQFGSFSFSIGLVLIAFAWYGAYLLMSMQNIEYEYILTNSEIETLYYFYDELQLSPEVITILLEYCVSNGKKNMNYIEKVAISWNKNGIFTIDAADKFITAEKEKNGYAYKIRKLFGIENRNLSKTEETYLKTWHDKFLMDEDMVELAYEYCIMQTTKLSFPYINSILKRWHELNIHNIVDAKKDHEDFKTKNKSQKDLSVYDDNNINYDELEEIMRDKM